MTREVDLTRINQHAEGDQGATGGDLSRVNKMVADLEQAGRYIPAAPSQFHLGTHRPTRLGVEEYLRDLKQGILSALRSGDFHKEQQVLGQVEALLGDKDIAKGFFTWVRDNQQICSSGDETINSAVHALIKCFANPATFLELHSLLDSSWISKRIFAEVQPHVDSSQRNDHALSDFMYDIFLKTDSLECKRIAAEFLVQLDAQALVPSLVRDLDDKNLSIESREFIAQMLGSASSHAQAAEALLGHVFPYPYENSRECFSANIGQFAGRLALGLSTGGLATGLAVILLPKNPYFLLEFLVVSTGVSTFVALRSLYQSLNKPRVANQDDRVKFAAAKALASMLTDESGDTQVRSEVREIVTSHIDRLKDHRVAGTLRRALGGESSSSSNSLWRSLFS